MQRPCRRIVASGGGGERLIGNDAAERSEKFGFGDQVSGGEADVKSQYNKQNDLAGGSRRTSDRTTSAQA